MLSLFDELYNDLMSTYKDLNEIVANLGGSLTEAYREIKRQEYIDFVYESIGIDASTLTEEQLRRAVRTAAEKSRADSGGSPTFYEYLEQEILKEMA